MLLMLLVHDFVWLSLFCHCDVDGNDNDDCCCVCIAVVSVLYCCCIAQVKLCLYCLYCCCVCIVLLLYCCCVCIVLLLYCLYCCCVCIVQVKSPNSVSLGAHKSVPLKLWWSPSLRGKQKRNSPFNKWLLLGEVVDVCMCLWVFPPLGSLVGAKQAPHIGSIGGPQVCGENKNEIPPLPPLLIFCELVEVCMCLWVFPPLGSLVGAQQAPHIGSIGGPQVCGENKNESPPLPPWVIFG